MKTNITSKDLTLTEGIESKILQKTKGLEKYVKGNKEIKVILSTKLGMPSTEIMVNLNKSFLKAEETSDNLYESIDLAVSKLEKQLLKHSEKKNEKGKESIKHLEVKSQIQFEEEQVNEPKIVKRKLISAKPMFEKEALLQMEMLNHRSFIFMNAETNEPCMTYKRHDGDYGIIELV